VHVIDSIVPPSDRKGGSSDYNLNILYCMRFRFTPLLIGSFAILSLTFGACHNQEKNLSSVISVAEATPEGLITDAFGIPRDEFHIIRRTIRPNENMASIFSEFGFTGSEVNQAMASTQGILDLRRVVAGRPLLAYYPAGDEIGEKPHFVVYEENLSDFVIFDMVKGVEIRRGSKEVSRQVRSAEGVINNSLYVTLTSQGLNPSLANALSEVFAWQIDFYRIQRGDAFRVIYEENMVDGVSTSINQIKAAYFRHAGRDYYAIGYEQGGFTDFYDLEGESTRKAFLRAPLEYSRISSRFTNRRFHPILQRNMPHHGTDYAAPTGTPIRATGDGTVVHAGYDNRNGNYVKIRHNGTYESGYLHMSRIAPGVRRGGSVRQGQIIGYVGSTGLATGPHLCYRFWVNGQPADPHRITFPSSNPVTVENKAAYNIHRTQMFAALSRPNSAEKPGAWSIIALDEITAMIPEKPLILSLKY